MRANAPAPPAKTPQQIAEEARRNQQQTVAISAVSALRAGMKDPESFQLVSLAVKEDGAGCVTYRAKNSFNATLQASAVFVPGKKPKLLNESTDGNRFVAEWNKRCTVAGGEDVTDLAARLMAR